MSSSLRVIEDAKTTPLLADYSLEGMLGKGGFSTVWAGEHLETGDLVAIKSIEKNNEGLQISWAQQERLILREVQTLAAVRGSSHIVQLLSVYEDEEFIYLVFELLLGNELFEILARDGGFPEDQAVQVLHSVTEAIAFCHDRHIVHRDVKPENLMTEDPDDPDISKLKLIDFGLAIHLDEGQLCEEQAGSPGYVAPEIIQGTPYGPPVDMWSLGITSYIVLVGFPPWDEEDELSVTDQIVNALYHFDFPEWDEISSAAKDFVSRCLTLDPAARMTARQALNHPFLTGKIEETPLIPPIEPAIPEPEAEVVVEEPESVHPKEPEPEPQPPQPIPAPQEPETQPIPEPVIIIPQPAPPQSPRQPETPRQRPRFDMESDPSKARQAEPEFRPKINRRKSHKRIQSGQSLKTTLLQRLSKKGTIAHSTPEHICKRASLELHSKLRDSQGEDEVEKSPIKVKLVFNHQNEPLPSSAPSTPIQSPTKPPKVPAYDSKSLSLKYDSQHAFQASGSNQRYSKIPQKKKRSEGTRLLSQEDRSQDEQDTCCECTIL